MLAGSAASLTTMIAESFSLEALTHLKRQRLEACAALQGRTKRRLVFARSEALELLAIEKPIEPESERRRSDADVIVATAAEKTHINGVRFLKWSGPIAVIDDVGRILSCTAPVCTWAHYAGILTLEELVVLADAMMRRNGHLTRAVPEDFVAYLDSAQRFAGIDNCRRALKLMRPGTDSSQETRTRLALMAYGLPAPEVNHPVRLGNGRTALMDMAYPQVRIAIEYDGGHHRFSAEQVLRDDKRREALERLGWIYIKVTVLDLRDEESRAALAERVASALEAVLGVPVPLTPRMTLRQVSDGRRSARRPIWERVPVSMWRAPWASASH